MFDESAYKKKYYQDNKDKIREKHREYYQKNKERILSKNKEWIKNNRDYLNLIQKLRRSKIKKKKVTPTPPTEKIRDQWRRGSKKYREKYPERFKEIKKKAYQKKKERELRKYLSNLKYERTHKEQRLERGRINTRNYYYRQKNKAAIAA